MDGNNPEIKETLPYIKRMADWTGEEVFMVVQQVDSKYLTTLNEYE